ncbi:MAG: hypothetical protein U0790_09630 [Isosphaeraceae bacterium]
MRTVALLAWLMIPVLVGAYHYGPGQEKLQLDEVAQLLSEADRLAGQERWADASSRYDRALSILPSGRVDEARRIRLEKAKVQMMNRQLPEANLALKELVDQLESDKQADVALRDEAREALANSQYYLTWLMRSRALARGLGARDRKLPADLPHAGRAGGDSRGPDWGKALERISKVPSDWHASICRSSRAGYSQAVQGLQERPVPQAVEVQGQGPQGKQEPKDAQGGGFRAAAR